MKSSKEWELKKNIGRRREKGCREIEITHILGMISLFGLLWMVLKFEKIIEKTDESLTH